MRKLLLAAIALMGFSVLAYGEDAFFKVGPLELDIPLKTGRAVYLYDFRGEQTLVGAETPVLTLWNRVEGTAGVVSSLEGNGSPFLGGNVLVGNLLQKYVTLPEDLAVGGFLGHDFNSEASMYGLKASIKLWK